jgi:DNA gyrase/topoisomerase IV subunit B
MTIQPSKKIQVLSDFEHILKRPTIYVGSVKLSEEMIPSVESDKICLVPKQISVGMYKLFDEVFSNCVDEAKRMKKSMPWIKVFVDPIRNSVTITDSGGGFVDGSQINEKSKMSNIQTAVSMLRAGSNFDNEGTSETLIGTNGMGVSLVNALSSFFSIHTTNTKESYRQEWKNFKSSKPEVLPRQTEELGTSVSFVPLETIFDGCRWDRQILHSILILKKRVLESEAHTRKIDIEFHWGPERIYITTDVLHQLSYKNSLGEILIWEKTENSGSLAFVNSAMCTGIHQKIILDLINGELEDSLGHHFYDFCLILNLPPALVKFGDQNKTKYVTKREEIERLITDSFEPQIKKFFSTPLFKKIRDKVEERKKDTALKKIRKEKKSINIKFSHKYFPPNSRVAENIFIVEGLSAMGSILQKRSPARDGVYALKGKIKNARNLSDLSDNKEILELMHILNLDPGLDSGQCPYQKIIIATDQDPDGSHITSLLISLFHNWFPWVIAKRMLYILETPLVTSGDKQKEYFYSLAEYKEASSKKKMSNIRYLKGLGSLSLDDWDYVMKNKRIVAIVGDKKSKQMLEMAFGNSSELRKNWLQNKI